MFPYVLLWVAGQKALDLVGVEVPLARLPKRQQDEAHPFVGTLSVTLDGHMNLPEVTLGGVVLEGLNREETQENVHLTRNFITERRRC